MTDSVPPELKIRSVGIVGAGTMGSRIAFQSLLWGKSVFLFDISAQVLAGASPKIQEWLRQRVPETGVEEALSRLNLSGSLADCVAKVELVIETVPENLDSKRKVFAEVDQHAPAGTLIATNSSSLPSSRLADATGRPDKAFNYNFNDLVQEELLVEVMVHPRTSQRTLDAAVAFVKSIGLVPVVLHREIMGFAMNRIWRAIKREALHLVAGGYASAKDIDRAWILSFGTRAGPFGRMDEIGIRTVLDIEMQYYLDSEDERDRPPAFLRDWVAQGRLGVKSGQGFYNYPDPASNNRAGC